MINSFKKYHYYLVHKVTIILYLILISLCSFNTVKGAEATQAFLNDISNIFISADIDKYHNHLAKNVDIMIDDETAIYSKTQAQIVLKNYLLKVSPKEFKVKYRSYTDKNEYLYLISGMKTAKGLQHIYLTLKWEQDSYKIIEIKIKPQ